MDNILIYILVAVALTALSSLIVLPFVVYTIYKKINIIENLPSVKDFLKHAKLKRKSN